MHQIVLNMVVGMKDLVIRINAHTVHNDRLQILNNNTRSKSPQETSL